MRQDAAPLQTGQRDMFALIRSRIASNAIVTFPQADGELAAQAGFARERLYSSKSLI